MAAFNTIKSHGGQTYTGMRVGGEHHWQYADAQFTQVPVVSATPEGKGGTQSALTVDYGYDSVKTRANAAPAGSGAAEGTVYHWFVAAELQVGKRTNPEDRSLHVRIAGEKLKFGHKRPHWKKFSHQYSNNTPLPERRAEYLRGYVARYDSLMVRPSPSPLPADHEDHEARETAPVVPTLPAPTRWGWSTTETTWNETKVTPDLWHIDVSMRWTPPTDAADADAILSLYEGSSWLIVGEQFATKANANQYQTSMRGTQFYLGSDSASFAELHCNKMAVMRVLLADAEAALAAQADTDAPIDQLTLKSFWGGPSNDTAKPISVDDLRRRLSPPRKRKRESDETTSSPGGKGEGEERGKDGGQGQGEGERQREEKRQRLLTPSSIASTASATDIQYVPGAVDRASADNLFFTMQQTVPWQTKMWRGKPLPRMTWHYQEGVCPELDVMLCRISTAFGIESIEGVFCNYYRNGGDYTPYHTDSYGCDVVSVSLGATRTFHFRHNGTKRRQSYDLATGDVLIWTEQVNQDYQHTVPRQSKVKDGRINLTIFANRAHPPSSLLSPTA